MSASALIHEVLPLFEDAERTVARITLHGTNHRSVDHKSTTTYFVLCGEGIIELDDQIIQLREGSEVTVPPETPYRNTGHMMLLATTMPPFDFAANEILS